MCSLPLSPHAVPHPQKQLSYNASKAGVVKLTQTLGTEWIDRGVNVNCISPYVRLSLGRMFTIDFSLSHLENASPKETSSEYRYRTGHSSVFNVLFPSYLKPYSVYNILLQGITCTSLLLLLLMFIVHHFLLYNIRNVLVNTAITVHTAYAIYCILIIYILQYA